MLKILTKSIVTAAVAVMVSTGVQAETLQLAHSTWVGYGPFYIAKEKGFFADEGLDIELVIMENTPIKMGALMAGQVDMVASTADEFPTYMKPGKPLKYILAVDNSNGGDGVVAMKEITSVADLKGKTIAFEEGSVSQFFINALLREAGLTQGDVEVVNMTATDAGVAFNAQRVDAAVTWEPALSQGAATDHGHLLVSSAEKPGLIVDVVAVREEFANEHKAELKGFVRAWTRALDYLKSNPDDSYAIMSRGVGGWLEDPNEFKAVVTGIEYIDVAKNKEMFAVNGQLHTTLDYAINIWRDFGKMQVENLKTTDVIDASYLD